MPRRNRSTRTDRYTPTHGPGSYPIAELMDSGTWESLSLRSSAVQSARIRRVHGGNA